MQATEYMNALRQRDEFDLTSLNELELVKFMKKLEIIVSKKYLKNKFKKKGGSRNRLLLSFEQGEQSLIINLDHDSFDYSIHFNFEDRVNRTGWITSKNNSLIVNKNRINRFEKFLNKNKMKKIIRKIEKW